MVGKGARQCPQPYPSFASARGPCRRSRRIATPSSRTLRNKSDKLQLIQPYRSGSPLGMAIDQAESLRFAFQSRRKPSGSERLVAEGMGRHAARGPMSGPSLQGHLPSSMRSRASASDGNHEAFRHASRRQPLNDAASALSRDALWREQASVRPCRPRARPKQGFKPGRAVTPR